MSSFRRVGPRGHGRAVLATVVLAGSVLLLGCSTATSTPDRAGEATLAGVDAAIESRIATDGLDGAALLVVRDGRVLRDRGYGSYNADTVVPIASASKWLTAATMMTLVDEGRISLDDRVATYLPEFTGGSGDATIRQLLSHTSGIAQAGCIWSTTSTLADCVDSVARARPASPPGTTFAYGNTSYSVAGRIIEVLTGESFETAFEERLAAPIGMASTRFDDADGVVTRNPVPAASAVSSLHDYGRFLRMIAADGVIDGQRVLSEQSVREMERDQVGAMRDRADFAVRTTGIDTYGLGVWRDVTTTSDVGVISSGNGAFGFYPWIDRARNAHGVLLVYDAGHSSERAVPASQRIVHQVWAALDAETGMASYPTPTVVHGR
ncbi:MAG: beta-lactamase family protein [Acidobacteria bacterium]|nr:beta-lactamase family protein [Acidobacteriota bacterium]